MAVAIRAHDIIERARVGQEVSAEERRHAIVFTKGQHPDISHRQLAEMFGVSESMIRKDMSKINQDLSEDMKATFKDTVIGELIHEHNNMHAALLRSLKAAPLGTNTYVAHCQALFKIRKDTIEVLQNIGALPKTLGEVSVKKEVFQAQVMPGTSQMVTRPLNMFDDFEEGEGLDAKLVRQEREKTLEGEMASSETALSAPVNTNGQDSDETKPSDQPA
jgi:hypothetical protein